MKYRLTMPTGPEPGLRRIVVNRLDVGEAVRSVHARTWTIRLWAVAGLGTAATAPEGQGLYPTLADVRIGLATRLDESGPWWATRAVSS